MKTKAEIVQALLNEGKITAEDAVVLLMDSKEKEYVYVPVYPSYPYVTFPYSPSTPVWYVNSFPAYSTTNAEIAPCSTASVYFTGTN